LTVGLYLFFSAYRKPEKLASSSAMDILKERYAKGEISDDQFHKMRKELE
jgi:uncharacterized membrane protein